MYKNARHFVTRILFLVQRRAIVTAVYTSLYPGVLRCGSFRLVFAPPVCIDPLFHAADDPKFVE